jgi:N utilization substance protein A
MTAFDDIFKSLRTERGVNRQSVVSAIESALLAAFTAGSDAPSAAYSRAVFDSETGEMRIERLRDLHAGDLPRPGIDVVDGPNGKEIAVVNFDELPDEEREVIELDPARFGRVAASAAKEALRREMRHSEQSVVYTRYVHRVGELVTGTVSERIASGLLITLPDAEAIITNAELIPGRPPRLGDVISAVIVAVEENTSTAQISLSQSDPRFVKAVFAGEVAEVKDGRIELVRIARTPGVRTKVAVASGDTTRGASSPIGIIVGERGSRIRLIRDALGEELDLLEYDNDPLNLVIAALAPAKVRRVEKSAAGYVAILAVDERDSVAGEDGQGLKLASELVGAPIELLVEDAANLQARSDEDDGVCSFIRPNGRRCVNAAVPGTTHCDLPGHNVSAPALTN